MHNLAALNGEILSNVSTGESWYKLYPLRKLYTNTLYSVKKQVRLQIYYIHFG